MRHRSSSSIFIATVIITSIVVGSLTRDASALDHGPFDRILREHVRHGRVDYAGIKSKRRAELEAYVSKIATTRPSGSKNARLAFYLNAYNALVIKGVVDRLPGITSVMKVPGFFDKIRHSVAGRKVTLNQLENKIIRPTFSEPRVHFALVCAARSCPPLGARAFRGAGLDRVLDSLARRFINSRHGVQVKGGATHVSQLFNWYAKDFRGSGSVGKYLAGYHKKHAALLAGGGKLSFLKYDWALNKVSRAKTR